MVSGNTRVNQDVPPFFLASDFDITAHGLNRVGLKRAGLSGIAISEIKKACQLLYRAGLPLKEALERMEREVPSEEVRQMVAFIRGSKRGICRDFRGKEAAGGMGREEMDQE